MNINAEGCPYWNDSTVENNCGLSFFSKLTNIDDSSLLKDCLILTEKIMPIKIINK